MFITQKRSLYMMSKTLILASVLAVALSACNKSEEPQAPAGGTAPSTTTPAPASPSTPPATPPASSPTTPAPGGATTPSS